MIKNNKNNKTTSNCYSITIRPGNGINLGSNPVMQLLSYIEKSSLYFIFCVEMDGEKAHFQGGVFYESSKRQDNIRRDLLKFTEEIYINSNGSKPLTDKGLENMRKHALKVIPHNDWDILVRYTLKEGINYQNTPYRYNLPCILEYYVPEQFCIHSEVKFYCSFCYKQETEELFVIPPRQYENLFSTYPSLQKKYENQLN